MGYLGPQIGCEQVIYLQGTMTWIFRTTSNATKLGTMQEV